MALRDYLRDEDLTEEDQIAMARESIAGLEDPNTAYMDFGIEEADPLPPQGDDLSSFIDQIAPPEGPPQGGGDIQQMATQSLLSGAPPPAPGAQGPGPQMPPTTGIPPAQQYYDEVKKARAGGGGLDLLSGVFGAMAGRQPQGPTFADIRGGERGMDLIRQVQEQRAQRAYDSQQAALDLSAREREMGQGAQSTALLQVFPEMDQETAEALSRDPKAFAAMMRHGEQIRSEKQDALQRQDQRGFDDAQWKERQAVMQADRLALKASGKRKGGGGRGPSPEAIESNAKIALSLRGIDNPTPEEVEAESAVQGAMGRKRVGQYIKELGTGEAREQRGIRKEGRQEASDLGDDMSDLTDYRSNLKTAESTIGSLTDNEIAIMLASPMAKRAWSLPMQKAHRSLKQFQNAILKVRSGAAVTVPEMKRLREELGNTQFANPKILREAFKQARKAFSAQERGIYDKYGDAGVKEYQRRGKRDLGLGGKDVERKQYSASRDQTRITYTDGSTEVVDGRQ